MRAFWEWLHREKCIIRDRDGFLRPLIPNRVQTEVFTEMLAQAISDRAIRVIVLKSRKMGVSSFIEALFYFISKYYRDCGTQTLAHTDESTADIFDIATRIYVEDPDWRVRPNRPGTHQISFLEHGSDFTIRTGGGHFASSGANRGFIHLSELGKWQGDPVRLRAGVQSILNSVPNSAFSIVVIESTANMLDDSGEFKHRCRRAQTAASSYRFVFSPWFDEPTYTIPGVPIFNYDDEEIKLKERFGLSDAQLAWRQAKIADECNGEVVWFHQDYPSTPEEAWETPLGRVFGMLRAEEHAVAFDVPKLVDEGYTLRRAIDWSGGTDPFVCLWVAMNDNLPPRLTIDKAACPETWREHEDYAWTSKGRPADHDDHTCDGLRYLVTHYMAKGHVHVFRELYIEMGAARGQSLLQHAQEINERSGDLLIDATVCDRSQPTLIVLLAQQGIPGIAYHCPIKSPARGEKIATILWVQALMVGSHPLFAEPVEEPIQQRVRRAVTRIPELQQIGIGEMGTRVSRIERGSPAGFSLQGYIE